MADQIANARLRLSLRRKTELISLLHNLMTGAKFSLNDVESPPWFQEGCIHQIDRTVYAYHADSKNVRWSDGHKFMFAVDSNAFQFFWFEDEACFGRQLTESETFRFCQLTNVKRYVSSP